MTTACSFCMIVFVCLCFFPKLYRRLVTQPRLSPSNFLLKPESKNIEIPWCLEGSFLLSLIGAHIQASVLHAGLNPRERLETAMCGFLAMNLDRYWV